MKNVGSIVYYFLLQEDGEEILLENGYNILLEETGFELINFEKSDDNSSEVIFWENRFNFADFYGDKYNK